MLRSLREGGTHADDGAAVSGEATYYILSLKWSRGKDLLVWYRPQCAGYTTDLNDAGVYTAEDVDRLRLDDGGFDGTAAIPVEAASAAVTRVVLGDEARELLAVRRGKR